MVETSLTYQAIADFVDHVRDEHAASVVGPRGCHVYAGFVIPQRKVVVVSVVGQHLHWRHCAVDAGSYWKVKKMRIKRKKETLHNCTTYKNEKLGHIVRGEII